MAATAAGVLVRLCWAIHLGPSIHWADGHAYADLAVEILAGRPYAYAGAVSLYPPLYPLLLAGGTAAFGAAGGLLAVQVLQALLGGAAVWAVARLAERLRPGAAPWAAWLFALEPWSIYFAGHILTETVGISLLVLGLFFLASAIEDRRPAAAVAAGLLLGLGALTRTVVWVVGWGTILAAGAVAGRRAWGRLAIAAAALLLAVSPWLARNYRLHGRPLFATSGGMNLYGANRPGATPHTYAADPATLRMINDLYARFGEVEADRILKRLAVEFIRENPADYVYLATGRVGRLWAPVPNWPGAPAWTALPSAAAYLLLVPFTVVGLASALRAGQAAARAAALVVTPIVLVTLLHAATTASIRYRLPAHPFLAVLAGGGLASSRDYFRMMRSARRP